MDEQERHDLTGYVFGGNGADDSSGTWTGKMHEPENLTPIRELLDDHQLYHSDLQMDSFITIRSGGTLFGCYKQALRELWKRYRGLKGLYAERKILLIDLEEMDVELSRKWSNTYDQRRAAVRRTGKQLSLEELDHNIRDTERELMRFYAQAVSLKSAVGELTPEKRAQLDSEMWVHKLRCMAAVDYMATGSLRENTVTLLQSLPPTMRVPLVAEIVPATQRDKLVNWFLGHSPTLPEPPDLPGDAKGLLDG